MTVIRTINIGEADEFLAVLCRVFGLDGDRARQVFLNEPMFDLHRKWALFDGGKIVSILTTVPLEFGWGKAIGIAGVATLQERQGEGLASRLLAAVLEAARKCNEEPAYLFARDVTLYERVGFELLDTVVRAGLAGDERAKQETALRNDQVTHRYNRWSAGHSNRLRRDSRRWAYWRWTMKVCQPMGDGYLCLEGGMVRECLAPALLHRWPVPGGTEWYGLGTMASLMGAPLKGATKPELYLMGRHSPGVPQMFMTDQF